MTYDTHLLWALANALVCIAIGGSCICRIRQMSADTTLALYRGLYCVLLTLTAASAVAPWWDEWPGPGCTLSNIGMMLMLLVNGRMWRYGVPPHARSDYGGLDSRPHHHAEPAPAAPRPSLLARWRAWRLAKRTNDHGTEPTTLPPLGPLG